MTEKTVFDFSVTNEIEFASRPIIYSVRYVISLVIIALTVQNCHNIFNFEVV